jgi:hypothetical protein
VAERVHQVRPPSAAKTDRAGRQQTQGTSIAQADEARSLANEKGVLVWKAFALVNQGCVMASTGKASEPIIGG